MSKNIIEQNLEFHRGFSDGYRQGLMEGQRLGQEIYIKAVEKETTVRYVVCEHCKDSLILNKKEKVHDQKTW